MKFPFLIPRFKLPAKRSQTSEPNSPRSSAQPLNREEGPPLLSLDLPSEPFSLNFAAALSDLETHPPDLSPAPLSDTSSDSISPVPNPQKLSPLFAVLPPELRNRIFYLALLEYDDTSRPVPFASYGYRPGYKFAKKISMSLLCTCKLAHLEARLIPVMTSTHRDWQCWDIRAPLDHSLSTHRRFDKMTVEQRKAVQTIQVFAQQFRLEEPDARWARTTLGRLEGQIRPKKLIITVRYHDWWRWEDGVPGRLRMEEPEYGEAWKQGFKRFGGELEEVLMELEMIQGRVQELDAVVDGVKKWRIERVDGSVLTTDGLEVGKDLWEGPTYYGGAFISRSVKQRYYVLTVRWKLQDHCKSL